VQRDLRRHRKAHPAVADTGAARDLTPRVGSRQREFTACRNHATAVPSAVAWLLVRSLAPTLPVAAQTSTPGS
jgi:hypothetical protein